MNVEETSISGLLILTPKVHQDTRGYFTESYNRKTLSGLGLSQDWVQDNESKSVYGVVRGLHFQLPPFSQTKLVRVISGEIYDVAVDLRPGSPTSGKWVGVILSGDNHRQLLIPKGFAHGFSVLSHEAIVFYKCDQYYHPASDTGIRYNDPVLKINWKIPLPDIQVSEKDRQLPWFDAGRKYFD
ncbi:MAG: dTDP-4-dehydrorhamnose 3,5-epimerase [Chlorobi bacterium]|nr:dTDP-4-dehydrorhamnose 3,5-epimerase [Chlorobiota bacterium]